MSKIIERKFGPCTCCRGTGLVAVRGGANPLVVLFSLGTSLERKNDCRVCGGTGRVVVWESEREVGADVIFGALP